MYENGLHGSMNPKNLLDLHKWKKQYAKDHPHEFKPIGTMIFCGSPGQRQGNGKTLSSVLYTLNVLCDFPFCILVTNIEIKDYPFNAHYILDEKGNPHIIDNSTGNEITSEDIVNGTYQKVCIEYNGLDCLKYISNGEYGVLYLIDEIHLELNSLESANIDIDVMTEISQQRKQRKHIVGTSQVFMRMAKPVREQIFDVIMCENYFKCLQVNKSLKSSTIREENGEMHAEIKSTYIFFHTPKLYEMYDTYAKMKRYNKEWKGRKRESPVMYQIQVERSGKK